MLFKGDKQQNYPHLTITCILVLLILNINNAISLIKTNSFLSGAGLFGLARMYCNIVYATINTRN